MSTSSDHYSITDLSSDAVAQTIRPIYMKCFNRCVLNMYDDIWEALLDQVVDETNTINYARCIYLLKVIPRCKDNLEYKYTYLPSNTYRSVFLHHNITYDYVTMSKVKNIFNLLIRHINKRLYELPICRDTVYSTRILILKLIQR